MDESAISAVVGRGPDARMLPAHAALHRHRRARARERSGRDDVTPARAVLEVFMILTGCEIDVPGMHSCINYELRYITSTHGITIGSMSKKRLSHSPRVRRD